MNICLPLRRWRLRFSKTTFILQFAAIYIYLLSLFFPAQIIIRLFPHFWKIRFCFACVKFPKRYFLIICSRNVSYLVNLKYNCFYIVPIYLKYAGFSLFIISPDSVIKRLGLKVLLCVR